MSLNHAVGPDADTLGEEARAAAAMARAGGRDASEYLRLLHEQGRSLSDVVELVPVKDDKELPDLRYQEEEWLSVMPHMGD